MGGGRRRKNRRNKSKRKVLPPELYLPPELWRKVLARLPVKTLLRFRAVCRTWCSVIDEPDFLSMHLNLFKNNVNKNYLLVMDSDFWGDPYLGVRLRESFTIITQLQQNTKSFKIHGNCNGLVVIQHYDTLVGIHNDNRVNPLIKLWNPSAQKAIYGLGQMCDYYSNGAAHWLVSDKEEQNQFTHVLSFDFGAEAFSYVKLPVVEDETTTRI
ncbi:F-box/kelch-repeat protein At3g06240-like [Spinacia oleracea]|uniref:F-box/kelch-repeat protein At3g06240-like n=1 Tax=Spinacia oleracea TaxID=3562 RepID=A0ABM3QPN6_SPIOL|nr:F-box/kelch-repeat protein At3g06240-like [Spinacia oleracea]